MNDSVGPSDSTYSKWGGFAAVIGCLPDAAEARASDARLDYLLKCFDRIEAAPRTYDGIVNTIAECGFTIEDVHRLNSPLLDGLYSMVCLAQNQKPLLPLISLHCAEPWQASILSVKQTRQYGSLLHNALCIGASIETLDYLHAGDRSLACDSDILQLASILGRVDFLQRCFSIVAEDNLASFLDPSTIVSMVRLAAGVGLIDVLRLLFRETNMNWAPDEALSAAARCNQLKTVRYLLDHCGPSIDISRTDALFGSLKFGHGSVAKLLLERGGAPPENQRLALLQAASSSGSVEAVESMLQAGAPIDGYSSSPLMCAVEHGHVAIVQLLLDRGANVRLFRGLGLPIAANCPNLAMLKFILDHPDLYKPICLGEALRVAARRGFVEHVHLLLKHGAFPSVRKMLPKIASSANATVVRLFLGLGADVHANNEDALVIASRQNPSIVPVLLEFGADISADNGQPLMQLIRAHAVDCVRSIIESGANLAPYHAQMLLNAVKRTDSSMFSCLLDHGVSPEECCDDLVAIAQLHQQGDHVKILRDAAAKLDAPLTRAALDRLDARLLHSVIYSH